MATILMDSSKVRPFRFHIALHLASRSPRYMATILMDSKQGAVARSRTLHQAR
jgi:hypothetical protein